MGLLSASGPIFKPLFMLGPGHTKKDAVVFTLRRAASSWPKRSVQSYKKFAHLGGFTVALKNPFTRTKFNVFAPSSYKTVVPFESFQNDVTCHETQRKLLKLNPLQSLMRTQRGKSGVFRGCEGNRGKFRASWARRRNNLWCDRGNNRTWADNVQHELCTWHNTDQPHCTQALVIVLLKLFNLKKIKWWEINFCTKKQYGTLVYFKKNY